MKLLDMKIKEIKEKSIDELNKILRENRDKLRELNFSVSQNQLKNVREVRKYKKTVARVLTVLNEKRLNK